MLYGFDSDESYRIGDWLIEDGSQDATVHGGVTIDKFGSAAFGPRAARFPGRSFAALEIPGTANLGNSFSLAAMVSESADDFSRLFSSYNGGTPAVNELVFDINPTMSSTSFSVRAIVNGTSVTRSVPFADSSYHHVAMTYDQGLVCLFLDGQQLGAASPVNSSPVALANDLRFGEDYPPTSLINELFEGFADDILVYDRALSAGEIASLYQNGAAATFGAVPPPPPPLPAIHLADHIEMFVDERMLHASQGVELKLQPPTKQEIVLPLNQPFEYSASTYFTAVRDEQNQLRLYYRGTADGQEVTLLATSEDGIQFTRPQLNLYEHNGSSANHIVWEGPQSHNMAPFLDTNPGAAPDARWKALGGTGSMYAMKSPDGIHWQLMQQSPLDISGAFDSQNIAFWDADAGLYRSYSRYWDNGIRAVQMSTSADFIHWTPPEPLEYDVPLEHFYTNGIVQMPEAGGIYLGFPMRFDPSRTNRPSPGQTGVTDAVFMASRDGIHWDRTFTEPWIPEGYDTTRSNMPAWGIIETGDDEWSMYATEMYRLTTNRLRRLTFRPYGFASVTADEETGWFEIPPITFSGPNLVLNFRTHGDGQIAVEIRDKDGEPIPGFTLADMAAVSGDFLMQKVTWTSSRLPAELIGQEIRLYFELTNADLFAFQFAMSDLPGDYDGSGVVDALDYMLWRRQFGLTGKQAADGNRDGRVDAADYVFWRMKIAASGAAAHTPEVIPEPAAIRLILSLALLTSIGVRHRRSVRRITDL